MARDEITVNYIDQTNITNGYLAVEDNDTAVVVANGIAITDACEVQGNTLFIHVYQDSGAAKELYVRPGVKLSGRTASAQPNALTGGLTIDVPNAKHCIIPIPDFSRYLQSGVEDYDGGSGNGGEIFIDFESGFDGGSNETICAIGHGTAFTA